MEIAFASVGDLLILNERVGARRGVTDVERKIGCTGEVANLLEPRLDLRCVGGGDLIWSRVVTGDNWCVLGVDRRQGEDDQRQGRDKNLDHCG